MFEQRLELTTQKHLDSLSRRREAAIATLSKVVNAVRQRPAYLRMEHAGKLPLGVDPLFKEQHYERFVAQQIATMFPCDTIIGFTDEEVRKKPHQDVATGFTWHLHSRIPPIDRPDDGVAGVFSMDLRYYAVSTLGLVADIRFLKIFDGQRNKTSKLNRVRFEASAYSRPKDSYEAVYGRGDNNIEDYLADIGSNQEEQDLDQSESSRIKSLAIDDETYETWPDVASLNRSALPRAFKIEPGRFAALDACAVASGKFAAALTAHMSPVERNACTLIARGTDCAIGERTLNGEPLLAIYRNSNSGPFLSLLREQGLYSDEAIGREVTHPA